MSSLLFLPLTTFLLAFLFQASFGSRDLWMIIIFISISLVCIQLALASCNDLNADVTVTIPVTISELCTGTSCQCSKDFSGPNCDVPVSTTDAGSSTESLTGINSRFFLCLFTIYIIQETLDQLPLLSLDQLLQTNHLQPVLSTPSMNPAECCCRKSKIKRINNNELFVDF